MQKYLPSLLRNIYMSISPVVFSKILWFYNISFYLITFQPMIHLPLLNIDHWCILVGVDCFVTGTDYLYWCRLIPSSK